MVSVSCKEPRPIWRGFFVYRFLKKFELSLCNAVVLRINETNQTAIMPKLILILGLFLTITTSLFSQFPISGCVYDDSGDPLVGASVIVKGSRLGTVTGINGCFTLNVPEEKCVLIIQYVGYSKKRVNITPDNKEDLSITMSSGVALMDVIVAKREKKRGELSRSRLAKITYDAAAVAPASYEMPAGSAETTIASDAAAATYSGEDLPAAGQLTAGEVNDFGKWELWEDISKEDLAAHRSVWKFFPEHRYTVQLTYPNGAAVIDATVILKQKTGQQHYKARTDNQGRAELWSGLFDEQASSNLAFELTASINGQSYDLPTATAFEQGINHFTIPQECNRPTTVDVAFVVDATGSMGDEINYLSSELLDVMKRSIDSLEGQNIRYTSVFYRDHEEEYLTRHRPFGESMEKVVSFFSEQRADGGGDTPEAVENALDVAINELKWNKNAAARLLFLVLDAPPHQEKEQVEKMQQLSIKAAEKGIRIIPVVCSGMDKSGEYLLRSVALATNGTYTFLTNHSGIGGDHLEPSTDAYEVEKLNDLLVRLITQFGKTKDCGTTSEPIRKPAVDEILKWSVYPSPTFGPITVKLPEAEGTVLVYDAFGKLLQRHPVSKRKFDIQLGQLPSGTYVLHYQWKKKLSVRRVIVSRA